MAHTSGFIPAYLARLSRSKLILWCYLCWYLTMSSRYFDPSPALWISSLGIAGIIGYALILSTSKEGERTEFWVLFRLFLMPFCVSSYAASIKGHGFFLIFSPHWQENALCLAVCAGFYLLHKACQLVDRLKKEQNHNQS